jgi:2-amino-4-hydroxy-6-hydroxymethyldihydropteridine diphosphokinase
MPGATVYVIGLGSNLGDRRALIASGVTAIAGLGALRAVSALYESRAVGPPQPDFLNAAVRVNTALGPNSLLQALQAIERDQGRVRQLRWGPRTLDLDILWADGVTLDDEALTIPHPRLAERAFALLPLVEVAPDASEPRTGRAYAEVLATVDSLGVRRLPGTDGGCWARR